MVNKGANFVLTAQNKGGAAMKQFQGQLQGIKTATSGMAPVNRSWNKGLSENRRAVQQLGFQMTDFTVQIAGGQNALLAFIQQGGQMLQVFGPVGAILATLLTVFGTLALVIGKSGKSLADMTPIVGVLADEFKWLANAGRAALDLLIGAINLLVNNLDTVIIAGAILLGWFAGPWAVGMIMATNVVRGLVFSMAILGVQGTAAMLLLSPAFLTLVALAGVVTAAFAFFGDTVGYLTLAVSALAYGMIFLNTQMMRFLPYALIAAVAWLIKSIFELKAAAGSWGALMQRVGDLVQSVFFAMWSAASAMGSAVKGVWLSIKAGAGNMIFWIADKWNALMTSMSSGFNSMMEAIGSPVRMKVDPPDWYKNGRAAIAGWRSDAEAAFTSASKFGTSSAKQLSDAWGRFTEGVNDNQVDVRDWFGGGADDKKGGGAKKVKEEVDKIKKIFEDLKKTISDSLMSAFKGLLDGTKSLKEAMLDVLSTILDKIIEIMMQPIFDGIARGIAGNIFGALGMPVLPSYAGGGSTGGGSRSGGVDGQGGFMALLHPKETVLDHTKGQSVGGGGGVVELRITEGSMFGARVEAIANDSAIKITREAVQEYDDRVLPVSVKRISAQPRRR